jgi:hypothetical protein
VLSFAGSVFRAVTLALVAVSVLAAVPFTALHVGRRLVETVPLAGEDARGARERILGASVVARLDAIRHVIPADGEYLLVDGGEEPEGATYWVRFELAPRRARFVGRLSEMKVPPSLPAGPRWVVVAFPDGPAALFDRDDFLRGFLLNMESRNGPR